MLKKSSLFLLLRLIVAANAFVITLLLVNSFGAKIAALYTVNAATLNLISASMRFGQQTYIIKKFDLSAVGLAILIIYVCIVGFALVVAAVVNFISFNVSGFVLLGAALHALTAVAVSMLRKLGHDFMALLSESLVPSLMQTFLLGIALAISTPGSTVANGYVISVFLTFLISLGLIIASGLLHHLILFKKKISLRRWKHLLIVQLSQSFSFFLTALGSNLIFQYIPIRLLNIYGDTEVAAYRVASNFYNVGEVILNNMRQLIVRRTIRINSASIEKIKALRQAARITFFSTALYSLIMVISGKDVINIMFDVEVLITWTMLQYLIVANLISAATGYHALALKMTDNHWLVSVGTAVSGAVFVAAVLTFPAAQASGFILQVAALVAAQNLLFLYFAWHKLGIRTSVL